VTDVKGKAVSGYLYTAWMKDEIGFLLKSRFKGAVVQVKPAPGSTMASETGVLVE